MTEMMKEHEIKTTQQMLDKVQQWHLAKMGELLSLMDEATCDNLLTKSKVADIRKRFTTLKNEIISHMVIIENGLRKLDGLVE